jgi:3'-phosphoadenosine 5'-phosphosulfate (PAPS) 3'-phosphatase
VPVVGEEAVESDPGLVDLIARPGESCWVVDPLDGTANFRKGRDRFAMIVCLVQDAPETGARPGSL